MTEHGFSHYVAFGPEGSTMEAYQAVCLCGEKGPVQLSRESAFRWLAGEHLADKVD
jgi:hypothetical protein